jgi:hypothetical protein
MTVAYMTAQTVVPADESRDSAWSRAVPGCADRRAAHLVRPPGPI